MAEYVDVQSKGPVVELGPGDSLGVSLAALLSGARRVTALDVVAHNDPERDWRVFDELNALFKLRADVPGDQVLILDAKRGDVPNTAAAYARAVFETLGADAVTANPYLGGDGLEPFLAYEERHTFVLCRTSNPGAGELQDVIVEGGRALYEHVASLANRCIIVHASSGGRVVKLAHELCRWRLPVSCPLHPANEDLRLLGVVPYATASDLPAMSDLTNVLRGCLLAREKRA